MASKTAYQFYHDEQMKSSKKNDGKHPKDIQKQIGATWTAMTQKEKQPYIEKKRQYDEQLQREQQALKRFQKQGTNVNSNTEKSRDNSKVANDKKNDEQNNKSQTQLKFVKTDLQKENVDAPKKLIVNRTAAQKVHQIPGGKLAVTGVSASDNSKKSSNVNQSSGNSSKPRESTVEKGVPSTQNQAETNHQAYLEFFKEQFVRYKKQFPKRDKNELIKVISQEWKLMGLSLKIREKENKAQSKQNKKFGVSRSSSSSGKGTILISGKEVDVPQKPLSGYLRFYKKNYEIYKTEQPELTSNMIAGLASAKWNSLTEDQKQEFNAPYTKELAAFQREKEEFIVRHGFFPSQNGQKNNESKAVVKPNEKKEKQPIKQADNENAHKTKSKPIPKKNYIVFNGSHIEYPVRLSGYYLFDKTLRVQLATKKHTMNSRELSAFIGEQWKSFPAESKEEFELQQEKEYLKKKVAFVAKYGPFPEKEKKESHRKKTDQEKKPKEAKNLNGKRSNDQALPEEGKQKKKVKLSEEEMQKKIERRGRINYEDPDSEVEDMLSCLEDDDDDQANLKTEKEEDFETFERNYNSKKNNITKQNKIEIAAATTTATKKTNNVQIPETNNAKVASTKKDTIKQNRNPLFDLLNQPIDIPNFTFGPSFF